MLAIMAPLQHIFFFCQGMASYCQQKLPSVNKPYNWFRKAARKKSENAHYTVVAALMGHDFIPSAN